MYTLNEGENIPYRPKWKWTKTCLAHATQRLISYSGWNEEMSAGLVLRALVLSLLWQSWGAQPEALEAPGNRRSRGVRPIGSIRNPALHMLLQKNRMTFCMLRNTKEMFRRTTFYSMQWNHTFIVLPDVHTACTLNYTISLF